VNYGLRSRSLESCLPCTPVVTNDRKSVAGCKSPLLRPLLAAADVTIPYITMI